LVYGNVLTAAQIVEQSGPMISPPPGSFYSVPAGTPTATISSLAPPPIAFEQPTCASSVPSLRPDCDACPNYSIAVLVGYDAFRGVSDDSWENNGIHSGANLGTRLGPISEWTGIGFQVGGTAGAYDWSGTDYRPRPSNAEMQGFLTYGLFRRPDENCAVTGAIVQDWMFNDNYGVFSQNPTLSQWRGQLGYALNWRHELGMWGTWHGRSDTRDVAGIGPTKWQAVNQLMAYWHYKFRPGGADTWIWLGAPDHSRLSGGGSLGSWIASAQAVVPLGDYVGLYTLVTYMSPSAAAGALASEDEMWNFSAGLAFYPRAQSRSSTVAGRGWMPLMPVANNGFFMVDTSNH
jgi:hypothetical protein